MKILNIIDTREYEEVDDDKWKAIPGSGNMRPCDRCGRIHEIHVYIKDDKDVEKVVGLGCAKQESMITSSQHKSSGSCAKTIAKLKGMIEMEEKEIERYNRAYQEALDKYRTQKPLITEHEPPWTQRPDLKEYRLEDVNTYSDSLENARDSLTRDWVMGRAKEILNLTWLGAYTIYTDGHLEKSKGTLENLQGRLEKAERKMEAIINS